MTNQQAALEIIASQQVSLEIMMTNQRAAVEMFAGISKELIRAALTMMTVEVVFVAYVLKERTYEKWWFIFFAIVTVVCAVVSIVFGGSGISANAYSGFKGDWSLEEGERQYQVQTFFCILGIISFFAMIFASGEKNNTNNSNNI